MAEIRINQEDWRGWVRGDLTKVTTAALNILRPPSEATSNQPAARSRQIPPIGNITKHEEFPSWRDQLSRMLKRFGLEKYILDDVTAPEDPEERQQWSTDRAEVDDYIQATVADYKVWVVLKGMGWDSKAVDPKNTFDMLAQYFWQGSDKSLMDLTRELSEIQLESFDSVESFQLRVTYIHDRLEGTEFYLHKSYYVWLVLKAISRKHPELHTWCLAAHNSDNFSWIDMMVELRKLAVDEKSLGRMNWQVEAPRSTVTHVC